MSNERVALLFDIDGTPIDTGGAGAGSWRSEAGADEAIDSLEESLPL